MTKMIFKGFNMRFIAFIPIIVIAGGYIIIQLWMEYDFYKFQKSRKYMKQQTQITIKRLKDGKSK